MSEETYEDFINKINQGIKNNDVMTLHTAYKYYHDYMHDLHICKKIINRGIEIGDNVFNEIYYSYAQSYEEFTVTSFINNKTMYIKKLICNDMLKIHYLFYFISKIYCYIDNVISKYVLSHLERDAMFDINKINSLINTIHSNKIKNKLILENEWIVLDNDYNVLNISNP